MPEYRFYFIKRDGHIDRPPIALDFPKDADALAQAKQYVDGNAVEIWQGARIVAHLDPKK
jgi:hypothetical protein